MKKKKKIYNLISILNHKLQRLKLEELLSYKSQKYFKH